MKIPTRHFCKKVDAWMRGLLPDPPYRDGFGVKLELPMVQYTRYLPEAPPNVTKLNHLHHDRTWFPDRILTALIYIKAPRRGGHTVFPGLMPEPNIEEEVARQAWFPRPLKQDRAQTVFRDGTAAYEIAEAQCVAAAALDDQNLAYVNMTLFPVPGDAIVFWHWGEDEQGYAVPAWENFHGACGVLEGDKMALQGFPTLPNLTRTYHQRSTNSNGSCYYWPEPHYSIQCF